MTDRHTLSNPVHHHEQGRDDEYGWEEREQPEPAEACRKCERVPCECPHVDECPF